MAAEHRVILKLDVRPDTPAGWLAKGKAVEGAASDAGVTFASISGLLARLGVESQRLDEAQVRAGNRGRLEVAERNAQWGVLKKSLRAFVGGVQRICDAAPDAAHAEAVAAAAALSVKGSTAHFKPEFAGKALGNGAVRLVGRRPAPRRHAYYEWEMSRDGGATWGVVARTNGARTRVVGLGAAEVVSFRYRKTVMNVVSEWSRTVVRSPWR